MPHSIEAEQGVLGSMLLSRDAIAETVDKVSRNAFYIPAHQTIYEVIVEEWNAGRLTDVITLTQVLHDRNLLDKVGGAAFVTHLFTFVPTPSNVGYYLETVVEKAVRRDAIKKAQETIASARDEGCEFIADSDAPSGNTENFALADLVTFDCTNDPTNLIGQRWNCQGGSSIWAGGAGYGKSGLLTQAGMYWATGKPFFGIMPVRPLKVLIIQAENDFGDTAEQVQGVLRGIEASGDLGLASDLQSTIARNITIVRVIGSTGAKFLGRLESLIRLHKPDLVIIDPLFAFAGCDLVDTPRVSEFLREGLIPIAVRNGICVHVVHHISKPSRDNDAKKGWPDVDFQYLGFGSSEIQNAFRAVNIFLPVSGHEDVYRLILSKRGSRAGAVDVHGFPTTSLYLARSKTGIFWTQIEKPQSPQAATRFKLKYSVDALLNEMSHTEGQKASALQKLVGEETGMARRTFYELWAILKAEQKIHVDSNGLWTKK